MIELVRSIPRECARTTVIDFTNSFKLKSHSLIPDEVSVGYYRVRETEEAEEREDGE